MWIGLHPIGFLLQSVSLLASIGGLMWARFDTHEFSSNKDHFTSACV